MLSFEQKKAIFKSFPELEEKELSNDRTTFNYPDSRKKGKRLAIEIEPNGKGYVVGRYMDEETRKRYESEIDEREWIDIKDFSAERLKEVIIAAMFSMSGIKTRNEIKGPNNHDLLILIQSSLKEMERNKCVLLTRGDLIQEKERPLYQLMYEKLCEVEEMVKSGEELSKVIRHKNMNVFMKHESFFMDLFDTRAFPKLFDLFEYE